jgi:hypothetical protein
LKEIFFTKGNHQISFGVTIVKYLLRNRDFHLQTKNYKQQKFYQT